MTVLRGSTPLTTPPHSPQRVRKGVSASTAESVERAALMFLGYVGKYAQNIPPDDGLVYPLSLQIYEVRRRRGGRRPSSARAPHPPALQRRDIDMLLKSYCVWMRTERSATFSTIGERPLRDPAAANDALALQANYMNGAVDVMEYVVSQMNGNSDSVLAAINLRVGASRRVSPPLLTTALADTM